MSTIAVDELNVEVSETFVLALGALTASRMHRCACNTC